jgi:hypothetical protein
MLTKYKMTEVISPNGQKMRFEHNMIGRDEDIVLTFAYKNGAYRNSGTLTLDAFSKGLAGMKKQGYTINTVSKEGF